MYLQSNLRILPLSATGDYYYYYCSDRIIMLFWDTVGRNFLRVFLEQSDIINNRQDDTIYR